MSNFDLSIFELMYNEVHCHLYLSAPGIKYQPKQATKCLQLIVKKLLEQYSFKWSLLQQKSSEANA